MAADTLEQHYATLTGRHRPAAPQKLEGERASTLVLTMRQAEMLVEIIGDSLELREMQETSFSEGELHVIRAVLEAAGIPQPVSKPGQGRLLGLSVEDAAAALGVSTKTLRRRIKAGLVDAERAEDGRWLVHLNEEAS